MTLRESVVQNSVASYGGGGIQSRDAVVLLEAGSSVSRCHSSFVGGGVCFDFDVFGGALETSGGVLIERCTTITGGGGLLMWEEKFSTSHFHWFFDHFLQ